MSALSPKETRAFLFGVMSTLYYLDEAGESTHYMEIAKATGLRDLWELAESMDRAHLRRQMRIASVRLPRRVTGGGSR